MKYKIVCDFCGEEHLFSNRFEPPAECLNKACRNALKDLNIIELDQKEESKPVISEIISSDESDDNKDLKYETKGLELTYQTTGHKIHIKSPGKSILGRKNIGSELLADIPQVSRAHCMIEFVDNNFQVKDLGSTNGTFVGLGNEKKNCNEPQILNENDFLILGEEVFLVKLIRKAKEQTEPEPELVHDKTLLCTECSCVLDKLPCICPDCGVWNE